MKALVEKIEPSSISGCYLAAYASTTPPAECGFVGYYKIFSEPAASYFAPAHCIAKGASLAPSAPEAAELALAAARCHLEELVDRGTTATEEDFAWGNLQFSTL